MRSSQNSHIQGSKDGPAKSGYFPVFLDVADKPALVVGGGEEAARKVRLLLKTSPLVRVAAPDLNDELTVLAAEGRIAHHAGPVTDSDLAGAALVVIAGDADGVEALAARVRALNVPVNVVDRPELCTAITPAIVDRDPVIVAIGSAGTAPVLARRVRARIEALLPSRTGALARFADSFRRAVKTQVPDNRARLRFWERVFDGPIAAKALAGDEAGARSDMLRALNRPAEAGKGSVALVGVGPGDPDLLTLKALRALQNADVVVHDALIGPEILDYVRRDADRIDVGKRKGRHSKTQAEITDLLVALAGEGKRVVRVKGGDPFIFGRGGEELEALRAAGIAVDIVPGITAALGAAAIAGLPLTQRGVADSVTLLTGHREHGLTDLPDETARGDGTLVIYMGLSVAGRIAEQLIAKGRSAATPVAVVERATWPDQRVLTGRLDDLNGLITRERVTGPALLVVGEAVRAAQAVGHADAASATTAFYAGGQA